MFGVSKRDLSGQHVKSANPAGSGLKPGHVVFELSRLHAAPVDESSQYAQSWEGGVASGGSLQREHRGTVPSDHVATAALRTLSWNEKRDLVEDIARLDTDDLVGLLQLLYTYQAPVLVAEPDALRELVSGGATAAPGKTAMAITADLDRASNGVLHVLRHYVDECEVSQPAKVTANDCGVCCGKWLATRPIRCGNSSCLNAVHAECFGVVAYSDPHTPWMCWDHGEGDRAQDSGAASDPDDTSFLDDAFGDAFGFQSSMTSRTTCIKPCAVCGQTRRAMKKTDDGQCVHLVCAYYLSEVREFYFDFILGGSGVADTHSHTRVCCGCSASSLTTRHWSL